MSAVKNIEWLNLNELRAYPIHEGADRLGYAGDSLSKTPDIRLDDGIFVDFKAVISGSRRLQLYIKEMTIARGLVELVVGGFIPDTDVLSTGIIKTLYDNGRLVLFDIFSGSGRQTENAYTTVLLHPFQGWGASTARIVLGRLNNQVPDGRYTFDPYQTWLEPCLVETGPDTITSLSVRDRSGNYTTLTGVVTLRAGSNTSIGVNPETNTIIFNALPGQGYIDGCDEVNSIKTINGVPANGISFVGDNSCITLDTSVPGTIMIKDLCSTPCCGCDELTSIVESLYDVKNRVDTASEVATMLETTINNIEKILAELPQQP